MISLIVAGFNTNFSGQNGLYADNSITAKLLAGNPKLNPQLYEKQTLANAKQQNRQASLADYQQTEHNDNIFVNTAKAESNDLQDEDQGDSKPFEYEVQGGDTLSGIADKYNIKLSTILWANNLSSKSVIKPGQQLTLLPVDGVLYTIKKGDTISKIVGAYKVGTQKVLDYNQIVDATDIHAGDVIIIPDGQPLVRSGSAAGKPSQPDNNSGVQENNNQDNPPSVAPPVAAGTLLWPTTTRNITQKYSIKHRGIDIANGDKPPIFASQSGIVEFTGDSGDWGNTILIRGDDGLVTRYSHALEIDVTPGQQVVAGSQIGIVGNTGRVRGRTGLHLDFRVYKNGVAVNPLNFLQ